MNLLTNANFDSGTDPWVWQTGSALETTGEARSLPNCAEVIAYRQSNQIPPPTTITNEGRLSQDVNLYRGMIYAVSAYVKELSSWGPAVIRIGETTWGIDEYTEVARMDAGDATDWTYLSGVYAPSATRAHGISLGALLGTGNGSSVWLFDDCQVEGVLMPRGMINAYKALMTQLKTINGSTGGYYFNLSSRVVPHLVEPDQMPGITLPYICLPLNDQGPYRSVEGSHVVATLQQDIYMFVPDTEAISNTDNVSLEVLKAHDDIMRCLMPETGYHWNLGDLNVVDTRPVAKHNLGRTNDGIQYGVAKITVEVDTMFGRSDLGPNA